MSIEYLAGYVDADGYFGLASVNIKSGKRRGYGYLYPQIQVGGVVRAPLEALAQEFGGKLFVKSTRRLNEQPMLVWMLSGRKRLEPVIRQLEPHLLVKRRQAQLLLRYFRECYRDRATWPRLSQSEHERRGVYKRLLSRLKRGDITLPPLTDH